MLDPKLLATNPLGPKSLTPARAAEPQTSLIISGRDQTRVVRLVEGVSMVLGRDPTAEISIAEEGVSRRHARFEVSHGEVTVSDLGSTNGTRLNGVRVQRATVLVGDEVTLGQLTVTLHALAPIANRRHGVSTHDQFLAALDDEVDRARTFRRGAAVVMVKLPNADAGVLAAQLTGQLRSVDRLALYGHDTFELLLPEANADDAMQLLAALGTGPWSGIATYPHDGTSAEALIEASRAALRRASADAPMQFSARTPSPGARTAHVGAAMKAVFDRAHRVAKATMPVLLRGESGTGKEVLAREIHERSPRRERRMASINCGAIPSTLVESVLFGHERGAFTGATGSTQGVFEEADGGTVLLDEVGELSPAAQAALLRVLETKEIRRVGASNEVKVDVRVIAATHRDLEAMVKAGEFREDLLYRLNAMTIEIPPLRERVDELGPLCERFMVEANASNGRSVKGIDAEAMRLVLRYPWPGNIRELRNAIEHAVVVAHGAQVQAVDLPRRVREFAATVLQGEPSDGALAPVKGDLRESVQRYEVNVILEALRRAAGNRTKAARELQIPVRTLSHKIQQYGIEKRGYRLRDGVAADDD